MKKILSVFLAITMLMTTFMSTTAFAVSETESARETKIYFEGPEEWGTLEKVYCFIYSVYGGKEIKQFRYQSNSTKCELVDAESNLFSFDTAKYCLDTDTSGYAIDDNADYGVLFSAINTEGRAFYACNLTLGSACIGDTVYVTGTDPILSPEDGNRSYIAEWKNNSDKYGYMADILSTGDIKGEYFPVYQPIEEIVAEWLADWAVLNEAIITTEKVKSVCTETGAEPQKVYDAYAEMYADELADIENNPSIAPLEKIRELLEITRETKIYFEAPEEWGTIKNVYCLIDNVYGGKELPYLKLYTDSTKCELVNEKSRLYSFDTSVYCQENDNNGYAIEDNADYFIVFSAKNTEGKTFSTLKGTLGSPCMGDTAKVNCEKVDNGEYIRTNYIIEWKNNSDKYGRQAVITTTGDIGGDYFPVAYPIEEYVADWLGDWADINRYVITTDKVKNICTVTGAEPQSVYDAYAEMYADELADIENNPDIAPLERVGVLVGLENTTYVVAGSKEICFQEWNGNPTEVPYNVMTKVGDVYKITFYYVKPCDIIEFKIVEYDYGKGSIWIGDISDRCFHFTVLEQCNVTITYNPETEVVDFYGDHIQLITSPFLSKVTVAGNGTGNWLNGVEWKPEDNSNVMTELEDKLYQVTYEDVEAGDNYQFKFTADGSWADNWSGIFESFGKETNAVYNDGDNILFSLTEKSDVTITLDLREFDFVSKQGAKFKIDIGKLGDVNTDGTINITDATDIMKYSAELIDETQINLKYADVNGDGIVNVLDATAIQKTLAGI